MCMHPGTALCILPHPPTPTSVRPSRGAESCQFCRMPATGEGSRIAAFDRLSAPSPTAFSGQGPYTRLKE